MSLRANPTAIGVFVCGAIVLAVTAVLIFGSGKLFRQQEQFIIYFADSVNGLSVGSPVKFKGVQIGQVQNIRIRYNQNDDLAYIPVLIEIDTTRLKSTLGVNIDLANPAELQSQKEHGLRAKLQLQSFLTGVLYVDLDYYDGLKLPQDIQIKPLYPEIPSVPSGMSEIMKSITAALQNISQIDFQGIGKKVDTLLDELNAGVTQINFKEINSSLVAATNSLNTLLSDPKLKETIAQLDSTLASFEQLSNNVNGQVQPLSNEIQLTTQRARGTLDEVDATLKALRETAEPGSSLRFELDRTLGEISSAARSLRILADYLERNPSSLITGKSESQILTLPAGSRIPTTSTGSSSTPPPAGNTTTGNTTGSAPATPVPARSP